MIRKCLIIFNAGTGSVEVAAVQCVEAQADLEPDLFALVTSVYLEDKPIFFLQVTFEILSKFN